MESLRMLSPEATSRFSLEGIINDNTTQFESRFIDYVGFEYKIIFDIIGSNGNYNLRLNNIKESQSDEPVSDLDEFKNSWTGTLQYNSTTGKANVENISLNLSSINPLFADITIDVTNSIYRPEETATASMQRKGRSEETRLLKICIEENGNIYLLYDNGEKNLFGQFAVASSNQGDAVIPGEDFKITISK